MPYTRRMSLPKGSIPCSALVLTRNSADTIKKCLEPLVPFAEILVHDANSEDNTAEIATSMGAKVLMQYPGNPQKSIRVSNFTDIRLKQRADAAYDWVMYVDADEEMTPELVEEVGEILKTAEPKTIIKFSRYPVIDGRMRTHGMLCPEISPRVHHRKSGATLVAGKAVHEKYQYDSSFKEVIAKSPLRVPLPSAKELRSKDDRYINLEVQKIWERGYAWPLYFRWIFVREPLIMLSIMFKILKRLPFYGNPDSVPFEHEWRFVRYHWRLYRAFTGALLAHPLTAGKIKAPSA